MKKQIAIAGFAVLVVLGLGHEVWAQGYGGYPYCVTRFSRAPMESPWAVPGTRCAIPDPETGYPVWGIVRILY